MADYLAMDRPPSPPDRTTTTTTNNSTTRKATPSINSDHNTYIAPESGFVNKMAECVSSPWQGQSDQPLPYTNDYLTPVSSPPAQHPKPQLPALPPGGFSRQPSGTSEKSVGSRDGDSRRGGGSVPRADSGIEADFPSRGRLSSGSTTQPRSSTIYECIDSNQYTDPSPTPHFFRGPSSGGESTSSGSSTDPTRAPLLHIAASASNNAVDDSVRRRQHPAYSPLNHSTPQVYTEACAHCTHGRSGKKSKGDPGDRLVSAKHVHCLLCGLAILIFLCVALVGVVGYLLFSVVPGMQAHIRTQDDDMKKMQSDFRNLSRMIESDSRKPTANHTLITSALTDRASMVEGVAGKIAELNTSVREFNSRLQQMGKELRFQMDNMDHLPDLKAVVAMGQMGNCFTTGITDTIALPAPASGTTWLPIGDQLKDNVVMSVSCGVEGGDRHSVETRQVPGVEARAGGGGGDPVQYRCMCGGRLEGHDRRHCQINLVLCPRQLPVNLSLLQPPGR